MTLLPSHFFKPSISTFSNYFPPHNLYEKPYRILMQSDSACMNTGYATCCRELANRFSTSNDFAPIHMAYNYPGQTLLKGTTLIDGEKLNFPIIGAGAKPYQEDVLEFWIKALNADIYWVLTDTFFLWPWFLNKNFTPAKSIFYAPSDGEGGLPRYNEQVDCIKILQKVDQPVVMSKFAQEQIKNKYNMAVPYIPIGCDTKRFYPLSNDTKDALRELMEVEDCNGVKRKGVLKGKFVIGSVFRNQPRKFPDRMIKLAKMLKYHFKIEDFVLLLHTDPADVAQTCDLRFYARENGVTDKIFFTGMNYFNGFPSSRMNEVYNVFDIFGLCTSGEGFGMCSVEAMACKVPIVLTDFTTSKEQIMDFGGQSGELIKLIGTENEDMKQYFNGTVCGSWTVERGIADIPDACEKIIKLKNDPELRKRYGEAGRKKVEEHYSWNIVTKSWIKLLTELIEK